MVTTPNLSPESISPQAKDQVIRALSEQRRRSTLQVLHQCRKTAISEIAKEIAVKEDDGPNSGGRSDAIRIDLYHRHIPILVEAGLVHYTKERDAIAISEYGKSFF